MIYIRLVTITAILTTTFSFQTMAQTEKGNFLVGGNIGFSQIESESVTPFFGNKVKSKVFTFNFNPNISYLIIDNVAAGLVLPYAYSKRDTEAGDVKSNSFSNGRKSFSISCYSL